MTARYAYPTLRSFATSVLHAAGLPAEPAATVAKGLIEADLLDHTTHGLALLADYVDELVNGSMTKDGRPIVLTDHAAVATWDAQRLPGIWTTALAVNEAAKRADNFGIGAIAIRRSHHIACLATFLEEPARRGLLILVLSSDPSDAHVAPFGGLTPVMTPNPIAAGIPTDRDPILIDISTSITTAAMCGRTRATGRRLAGPWLLDRHGSTTDDPTVMTDGGTILPIGRLDHGHKGYGLGLLVEALTQGLSGFGRAEGPTEWGASVLVLAFSPALFGGLDSLVHQTGWLAEACRTASVPKGASSVRLPGEAGLEKKRSALANGMILPPNLIDDLSRLATHFGLPSPTPM